MKRNEYLNAYTKFGQRFFRKLVCMKPGSRQPTVRAGEPASENNQRTTLQSYTKSLLPICLETRSIFKTIKRQQSGYMSFQHITKTKLTFQHLIALLEKYNSFGGKLLVT